MHGYHKRWARRLLPLGVLSFNMGWHRTFLGFTFIPEPPLAADFIESRNFYSITSSARTIVRAGTVRLRAFAVLRLMIRSYPSPSKKRSRTANLDRGLARKHSPTHSEVSVGELSHTARGFIAHAHGGSWPDCDMSVRPHRVRLRG